MTLRKNAVESIMQRGENASNQYFSLICIIPSKLRIGICKCLKKKPFENIVEKGENAGNQQCFPPFPNKYQFFIHIYYVFCKCFQFGPV